MIRRKQFYNTYEEARKAAEALGIRSHFRYLKDYKADPKLPSRPEHVYPEFVSWPDFLGEHYDSRPNTMKFDNYEEARDAARLVGFCNQRNYRQTCNRQNGRFLTNPEILKGWVSWQDYLGLETDLVRYQRAMSYAEAKKIISEQNIKSTKEYHLYRKQHPGLPHRPYKSWKSEWFSWSAFFADTDSSLSEFNKAKEIIKKLNIKSNSEYYVHTRTNKSLPRYPDRYFKEHWSNWEDFLGVHEAYSSMTEASAAARELGIGLKSEYTSDYSRDPKLPFRPDIRYKAEWQGWRHFLFPRYESGDECAAAARKLGITDGPSYGELRHLDERLPAEPRMYYGNWNGWLNFLMPSMCHNLADVKYCIKALGIKNSQSYVEEYKNHTCLPRHPDRVFKEEWVNWYDTCSIPRPYDYDKAKEIISRESLANAREYKAFVLEKGDEQLPLTPDKVYKAHWISWNVFLGKPEPYTLRTLRTPLDKWREAFAVYMRFAKLHNEYFLVFFAREYIAPLGLSEDPKDFYCTKGFDFETFLNLTKSLAQSRQLKLISTMRAFTKWFHRNYLSVICEETGEAALIEGVRDPFSRIQSDEFTYRSCNQTVKPALAYQHVAAVRDWIIPTNAKNFSDLKHLQSFDHDWLIVEQSLIDTNDPDCVWQEKNGVYRIWFPAPWLHTYALASVPIRGIQLAYVDSGEADREIPVIVNGQIQWVVNDSALKDKTDNQSFVKRYPDDELGMFITTNKTSRHNSSYSVPWIPENLAFWMIRLRDWQAKYNPIQRTMPWVDCTNTNLTVPDRAKRPNNCFLFREFGGEECTANFGSRLHRRTAVALYNVAPQLASLEGNPRKYNSYDTDYTPHTMRVSLITAYVMEFRLPLSIIVKIVGHSSIVMTIYYVKINGELLRKKFSEGEKRALSDQSKAVYQAIQQKRIDSVKNQLITNNEEAIRHLVGEISTGSSLFRDYGICPFASSRCSDGFESLGKFIPVPSGYLGSENCPRCRHFVTGPVFLGGLLSLANEISLTAKIHFEHLQIMEDNLTALRKRVQECENQQYDAEITQRYYDLGEFNSLKIEYDSLFGQIAAASVKADMYLCDLNAINRIAVQCQSLINTPGIEVGSANTQLIVQSDYETVIEFEDVSQFHQYQEICENAEIYVSAKADIATPRRSQMIDRMAELNSLTPAMFRLDHKKQLKIGNQIVKFLLTRLKSFEKVDSLMNGEIALADLPIDQRLTPATYQRLLSGESAQEVLLLQEHETAIRPLGETITTI